jgi:hypothetical protein
MSVDRAVLALAGTMILIGALFTAIFSTWWLLLIGFVGLNLVQSSVTGFCPAAMIFGKLGLPTNCAVPTVNSNKSEQSLLKTGL